jgi:hypothetical protein
MKVSLFYRMSSSDRLSQQRLSKSLLLSFGMGKDFKHKLWMLHQTPLLYDRWTGTVIVLTLNLGM